MCLGRLQTSRTRVSLNLALCPHAVCSLIAQQHEEVFDLVQAASGRLGRTRSAHNVGRLSFIAGRYSLLGTSTQVAATAHGHGVSFSGPAREGPLPLDAPVPAWLEEAAKQMDGQGLDSGGLLAGIRNLMILRPWSLYDTWLTKGSHLMSRGHYASARELLLRARNHAR